MNNKIESWNDLVAKCTIDLQLMRKIGKAVGIALMIVFGALGIVMLLAFLPAIIVIGALVLIGLSLYKAFTYVWKRFMILQIIIGGMKLQFRLMAAAIRFLWETFVGFVSWIWNFVQPIFQALWDFFNTWVLGMFDIGVGIVRNMWDGIKSMWGGFVSWLTAKIKATPILGRIVSYLYKEGGGEEEGGTGIGTAGGKGYANRMGNVTEVNNSPNNTVKKYLKGNGNEGTNNKTAGNIVNKVIVQIDGEDVSHKVRDHLEKRKYTDNE